MSDESDQLIVHNIKTLIGQLNTAIVEAAAERIEVEIDTLDYSSTVSGTSKQYMVSFKKRLA
jgi:hypothetical protein